MRHVLGLIILLLLTGVGMVKLRSLMLERRRQRHAAVRGMRISIPHDDNAARPTDTSQD